MSINKVMKFYHNILNDFQVQSGHAWNANSAIFHLKKIHNPELWFLCSARCLCWLNPVVSSRYLKWFSRYTDKICDRQTDTVLAQQTLWE